MPLLLRFQCSPPQDDDVLGPEDSVSCLHDGCALSSDVPGDCPPLEIPVREDLSPSPLQNCRCASTLSCGKKSRTEEGECSQCEVTVEDVRP